MTGIVCDMRMLTAGLKVAIFKTVHRPVLLYETMH